jgi:mRNA interferase HigB
MFSKREHYKNTHTFVMKVHLIRKSTIDEFVLKNIQSKRPFDEWLSRIKYANWWKPADILETFPCTDLLGNGSSRAVFDIGGNNYRMIGKYGFGENQVHLFICWIGTHAEYEKLCDGNKQFIVNMY